MSRESGRSGANGRRRSQETTEPCHREHGCRRSTVARADPPAQSPQIPDPSSPPPAPLLSASAALASSSADASATVPGYWFCRRGAGWLANWIDECGHQSRKFLSRGAALEWARQERLRLESPPATPSLFTSVNGPPGDALPPLIDEYRKVVRAGGATELHAQETRQGIHRLCTMAGFSTTSQIAVTRIKLVLAVLTRKLSAAEAGISAGQDKALARLLRRRLSHRSSNKHLGSMKRFCTWLESEGKLASSTCAAVGLIRPYPVKLDRRTERGALRDEQLALLINTAMAAAPWNGFSGLDRAALWYFLAATGLREGTARRLTIGQFSLLATQPGVSVLATQEKGKKARFVPLRLDDAAWFLAYFDDREPEELALQVPHKTVCAEMLRADLRAAGLPEGELVIEADGTRRWVGKIDCHSLKSSYATRLALAGAGDTILEELVGHHTAATTKANYVKHVSQDSRDTIARLRPLAIAPPPRRTG